MPICEKVASDLGLGGVFDVLCSFPGDSDYLPILEDSLEREREGKR